MPSTPGITDITDANFVNAILAQSDCENYDDEGNAIGNIPEASALHQSKPTAEKLNWICAALRSTSTWAIAIAAGVAGNGAALSLYGRSANSSGARGDITFGSEGHVLRRNSNTLSAGTLVAGSFATGPGIVTFAMMDNGAACSVGGRSANSSGARADISISEGQFLGRRSNVVGSYALASNDVSPQVVYSVDFSTLSNNTLSNGAEVIDGLSWTVANAAAATTFAVENGTGIHFDAAASSTAYTTSSRTATNISIPITTLIPSWDPTGEYIFELYFSSLTLGTSLNRVYAGLENTINAGAERMMGGGRQNSSGTQQTYTQITTTLLGSALTHDCFGLHYSSGVLQVCSANSSGGDFPSVYAHAQSALPGTGVSVMASTSTLTIAFVTGEAGGAMDAVLRRLRIRRLR